jgi:hypothetical protein
MAKLCIVFLASFFVFSSNKNESRSKQWFKNWGFNFNLIF